MKGYISRAVMLLCSVFLLIIYLCVLCIVPLIGSTEASLNTNNSIIVLRERDGNVNSLGQLNIFSEDDKEGIIAPMGYGSYTFTVENGANFDLDYVLTISDENIHSIPMVYRLKDGVGKYLIGNEESWVSVSEMEAVSNLLSYKGFDEYTLDWAWKTESNLSDTELGVLAQSGKIEYVLNFNIVAEQNGDFVNENPKTGDVENIALCLSMMTTSFVIILVLLYVRKKDEKEVKEVVFRK